MSTQMLPVRVGEAKAEVHRLCSAHPDGTPMFPGPQLFIWTRPPHFPWLLAGFEPHVEGDGGANNQEAL